MILGIIAVAGAFGLAVAADDSDAATLSLSPEGDDYAKVSTTLTYTLDYVLDGSSATYKAELLDGKTSVGAVSPSSGTLYSSSTSRNFTVTLPSEAGDYELVVTVTEGDTVYTRTAAVRAVDPIVLSVTIENGGNASRTFMVYFYIQVEDVWVKIDDSGKEVTVPAKGSYDVTYDYIVRDVHKTTFCLMADTGSLGEEIKGLGAENSHTFYTSANDYRGVEYICIGALVILAIIFVVLYRKPVKNLGKPKGRR